MRLLSIFLIGSLLVVSRVSKNPQGQDDSVSIVVPAPWQIFQRAIGMSSGVVRIEGRFSGDDVRAVEARVIAVSTGEEIAAGIRCDVDRVTGFFSGMVTVPQGGWYSVVVEALNSHDRPVCRDTSGICGVGINVLCIGQSNMVGNGDIRTYTKVTAPLAGLFSNDGCWKKCADPYDDGGMPDDIDFDPWRGASMIPAFVNTLAAALPGVPIGVVPAAKGASALHGDGPECWVTRNEAFHADRNTLYGNSIAKARAAGGVELIIMHQGETDATNETPRAHYMAGVRTLLGYYREDLYPEIPLFICQLACSYTRPSYKNRTDRTMQEIREAQFAVDDPPDIYLAAVGIDVPVRRGDDHYFREGYDTIGARVANAVKFHYGLSPFYRGPSIKAARFYQSAKTAVEITIAHRGGSDFLPHEKITGFEVFDNGNPVRVVSAGRTGPGTIRLDLKTPVAGEGTMRYLYGKRPKITGAVRDNSPVVLPLEPTAGFMKIQAE